MILSHIKQRKTPQDVFPLGSIIIEGGESKPCLSLVNEYDTTKLGVLPARLDTKSYQEMDENHVLDREFLLALLNSSHIGPGKFKVTPDLAFAINPLASMRYNKTTNSFDTTLLSGVTLNGGALTLSNEIPSSAEALIEDWMTKVGYTISSSQVRTDTVKINYAHEGQVDKVDATYYTKIITPLEDGTVDATDTVERVLKTWKVLDNDRFMKVLTPQTNLGNHCVITQFPELSGSYPKTPETKSDYREIKARVQYKVVGKTVLNIATFNLYVPNYGDAGLNYDSLEDNSLQLIGNNTSVTGDPVYVVKLTWDKSKIEAATILDLNLYDNDLAI